MSRLLFLSLLLFVALAAGQSIAQPTDSPDLRCKGPDPPAGWKSPKIVVEPALAMTAPTPEDVSDETMVMIGVPRIEVGGRWVNDKPITDEPRQSIEPALVVTPDGRMFVAVEDHGDHDGWISIHQSTDGGESWTWRISFRTGVESRNPAITYAERSTGDQWLFLVYQASLSDESKTIQTIRIDPRNLVWDPRPVATNIMGVTDIYPRVCTDDRLYEHFYVYVVYTVNAVDYYPVMFARSLDYGLTYETPQNITGGSESSTRITRPDVAFGNGGLFVAFEKPGWTGSTWASQVWVTHSGNFGSGWSEPSQLTSNSLGAWHPAVAAAVGTPSVVVAYTHNYASEADIHYAYTGDSGTTWFMNRTMPWTYDDERTVALSASGSAGRFHAAWWRDYDIVYASAAVTSPGVWTSAKIVNEANLASAVYSKPALCTDAMMPPGEEACAVWTDMRSGSYQVFFDAGFRSIGDMNCDGFVTVGDIGGFVLALTNPAQYAATYPDCDMQNADANGDGFVTVGDIGAFVALLTGG